VRKENDLQLVQLARQARELLNKPPKHPLHFRDLRHEQRVPLARLLGGAPVRTVSVLIHKPSISEPEIYQQQSHMLYRYASRLLLERVSWLCRDNRRTGSGDGRVELVFSNRSAMSYDDLRVYLSRLREDAQARTLEWDVIDPKLLRAVNHDQLAGLQLADAVASGVFYAVHRSVYGEVEDRYLKLLAPTIFRRGQRLEGFGLKFWCAETTEIQRVLEAVESQRS
jgi:hypothetical protein